MLPSGRVGCIQRPHLGGCDAFFLYLFSVRCLYRDPKLALLGESPWKAFHDSKLLCGNATFGIPFRAYRQPVQ